MRTTKSNILSRCLAAMAASAVSTIPYSMQIEAQQELARRSSTLKTKGPNAKKGKRHASLKSRSNKRK